MIVTIDGPAGAGKSTVARELARRLGFRFLDTGAMYRAVALAGLRRGVDWQQPEALAALVEQIRIDVDDQQVRLDGEDVTEVVRTLEVTAATRHAADNPHVRQRMVQCQRQLAGQDDIVTEGRDQGTLVFPEAQCKIFLTASPQERATRRLRQLQAGGQSVTLQEVLATQQKRDQEDMQRPLGALKPAKDAIELNTDGLTVTEVVDRLEAIVRTRKSQENVPGNPS